MFYIPQVKFHKTVLYDRKFPEPIAPIFWYKSPEFSLKHECLPVSNKNAFLSEINILNPLQKKKKKSNKQKKACLLTVEYHLKSRE